MKRLILAVMLAGLGFGPVLAGNDFLFVKYNGERHRIAKLDFNVDSVCGVKKQVADMFDLPMKKFDLRRTIKLPEDKTLAGARIGRGQELTVDETNHSFQCT